MDTNIPVGIVLTVDQFDDISDRLQSIPVQGISKTTTLEECVNIIDKAIDHVDSNIKHCISEKKGLENQRIIIENIIKKGGNK